MYGCLDVRHSYIHTLDVCHSSAVHFFLVSQFLFWVSSLDIRSLRKWTSKTDVRHLDVYNLDGFLNFRFTDMHFS